MGKALTKTLISLGIALGGLWLIQHSFRDTAYETIGGWISLAFAVSVVAGAFITIQYSEKQWYKQMESFSKRYLVWVLIAIIAVTAILHAITQ